MLRQPVNVVDAQIESCLARCRDSETPLARLAETIALLQQQGWREADVRDVEKAVLKVLLGILIEDRAEPSETT